MGGGTENGTSPMSGNERKQPEASRNGQERAIANEQRERADGHGGKRADCVVAGYCEPVSVGASPDLGAGDYLRPASRGEPAGGGRAKRKEIANGSELQFTSISTIIMEAKRRNIPHPTASRSAPHPSCRQSGRFSDLARISFPGPTSKEVEFDPFKNEADRQNDISPLYEYGAGRPSSRWSPRPFVPSLFVFAVRSCRF